MKHDSTLSMMADLFKIAPIDNTPIIKYNKPNSMTEGEFKSIISSNIAKAWTNVGYQISAAMEEEKTYQCKLLNKK